MCYFRLFRKTSPANEAPTNTGTHTSISFLLLCRQCSCHEPWVLIPSPKSAWSKTSGWMKKWCQPELCPRIWELLSKSKINAVIDMQLPAAPWEAKERQSRLTGCLFLDHLHVGRWQGETILQGRSREDVPAEIPPCGYFPRKIRPACFLMFQSNPFSGI